MRKFILALALAAAPLAACTSTQVDTVSTQVVIGADASYEAASKFGMDLVSLGKLDKDKFKAMDNTAYMALVALRAAQAGGTADSVAAATANFSVAIAAIYALKGQ